MGRGERDHACVVEYSVSVRIISLRCDRAACAALLMGVGLVPLPSAQAPNGPHWKVQNSTPGLATLHGVVAAGTRRSVPCSNAYAISIRRDSWHAVPVRWPADVPR